MSPSSEQHPAAETGLSARFWGVRGSIASPGADTVRYGGNTPCLEVRAGGRLIILDGGTGLRCLGQQIMASGARMEADLFFSHLHWDHIQGFPFFTPAFLPGNTLRIHGQRRSDRSLKAVLEGQMTDPNFPVPLSIMRSKLSFHEVEAGETVDLSPVRVRTAALNHPGGCLGLRIEHGGKSFVYTTDTEHDPISGNIDAAVVDLARDADVLVYDAMYTDAEYRAGKIGWGHSTYTEALRIAAAADARALYLFHHDPVHSDDFLDARLAECRAQAATAAPALRVEMAREGDVLRL